MSQWYCRIEEKPTGPYSLDELCFLRDRGKINRNTEVQCGDNGPWSSAGSVKSLFPTKTPVTSERHLSAGINEPRQPQAAAELNKAEQPAEIAKPVAGQQRPTPPTAPTLLPHAGEGERLPRIAIGSSILAGLLLLFFLIWLLLHLLTNESQPVEIARHASGAVAQGSTSGGSTSGSTSSMASGTASSSSDLQPEKSSSGKTSQQDQQAGQSAADQDPPPSDDDSSEPTLERDSIGDQPPDEPAPTALFQVNQLASESPPVGVNGEGVPMQPAEEAESGIDSPVKTIGGVKVKGKIALVCDISGSMQSDFPILVRELRDKFPPDTPLLLVNGCNFSPPNPGSQPPRKLVEMHGRSPRTFGMPMLGVNLNDDEHVYYANTTSDAIIFAVKELRRGTVMFNNDLQDGGSIRAIDAFEDLRKEFPFVLSGRSLNRDAPKILHDFIEASGGEFKLDPIGRQPQPAVPWY